MQFYFRGKYKNLRVDWIILSNISPHQKILFPNTYIKYDVSCCL